MKMVLYSSSPTNVQCVAHLANIKKSPIDDRTFNYLTKNNFGVFMTS